MRRLVVALLLLSLPCLGQLTPHSGGDSAYEGLLERARGQDATLDFSQLREAYVASPGFSPYGLDEASRDAGVKALREKRYAEALAFADKLLEACYLDLEGHLLAHSAALGLGDEARAGQHRFMLDGLFGAIGKSGDGTSPETAWKVISVREEYILARMLEAEVLRQALLEKDGHHYDVLTVRRRNDLQERRLYFNIDVPFAWMEKSIK